MKATLVFLSVSGLFTMNVLAQEWGAGDKIEFHQAASHIRLGGGVNKNFPLIPKKTCLLDKTATDLDVSATEPESTGAVETSFDIEFIESSEELHNLLSVSGLIAAHKKFRGLPLPKFNLSAQGSKESRVSKTSLSLVIKAKSNYGRQMLDNQEFELKPKYQEMLDMEDYDKFQQNCGSHFVAWQKRAGVVSAIYTVENLTEDQKKQLKAAFEIGNTQQAQLPERTPQPNPGNTMDELERRRREQQRNRDNTTPSQRENNNPLFRNNLGYKNITYNQRGSSATPSNGSVGGARLSLDNFLREAHKISKKCTLKFHANGGAGLSALGLMASGFACGSDNQLNVTQLFQGLGSYLTQFDFHSAPPVEYNLMPYFDYEPIEEDINHHLLKAVYYRYVDSEAYIVDIIKKLEELSSSSRASQEEAYFTKKLEEMDEIRHELWEMSQNIIKNNEESKSYQYNSIPKLPVVAWNKYRVSFIESSYTFDCYVKHNDPETKCGMAKNHYYYMKPISYWEANFVINARISKAHKVETVNIYLKGAEKQRRLMASAHRGTMRDKQSGSISFINDKIEVDLGKMTHSYQQNMYVKLMSEGTQLPSAIIEIVTDNGNTLEKVLSSPELIGAHARWKRSNKVDYSELYIPAI